MAAAKTQTVQVRFYATLRAIVGGKHLQLPLPEGSTVLDRARARAERHPELAEHFMKNPAEIGEEELRKYFLYLKNVKKWARPTCTTAICGRANCGLASPLPRESTRAAAKESAARIRPRTFCITHCKEISVRTPSNKVPKSTTTGCVVTLPTWRRWTRSLWPQ